MTVDWGRNVKHYFHEGGYAREGVNLRREEISLPFTGATDRKARGNITDPYRPSVWAVPFDDTPFIMKSRQKFPTGYKEINKMS